jgi:hypothetical protein
VHSSQTRTAGARHESYPWPCRTARRRRVPSAATVPGRPQARRSPVAGQRTGTFRNAPEHLLLSGPADPQSRQRPPRPEVSSAVVGPARLYERVLMGRRGRRIPPLRTLVPSLDDCLKVISQAARSRRSPAGDDVIVILETLRLLGDRIAATKDLAQSVRRRLSALPVWTSQGWKTGPLDQQVARPGQVGSGPGRAREPRAIVRTGTGERAPRSWPQDRQSGPRDARNHATPSASPVHRPARKPPEGYPKLTFFRPS